MSLASVPNIYCSLCGVVLGSRRAALGASPGLQAPWYCQIRAVFVDTETSSAAFISGDGSLLRETILLASSDFNNPDLPRNQLSMITLFQNVGRYWGYGFHDACWKLLSVKLSRSGIVDRATIAQSLFRLFYMTECPGFAGLSFAHDFGGVSRRDTSILTRHPAPNSPESADPLLLPPTRDLTEYGPAFFNSLGSSRPSRRSYCVDSTVSGPISRVPLEIFHLIMEHLSIADVANVGLACRQFSQITDLRSLTQPFWRNRFLPGFELDYIFLDGVPNPDDWFHLFCGVTELIKNKHRPFLNKKRIWDLLEHVVHLVRLNSMGLRELHGKPVVIEDSKDNIYRLGVSNVEEPSIYFTPERSFSGLVAPEGYQNQITEGCRLSGSVATCFRPEIPDGHVVKISTVTLGGRYYVSGFGCVSLHKPQQIDSRVGFFQPEGEEVIQIPCHLQIEYIEVAFCASGLTGIRFLCSENHKSRWVGQNQGPGIAYGVLQLGHNANSYNLVVGLDGYKIVSLSSMKTHDSILNARNEHCGEEKHEEGTYIQSRLWSSGPPHHSDITLSALVPQIPSGPFEPLISIDFGGPGGALLGSLTGITAHMISSKTPVVGMTFIYGDKSITFGRLGAVALTVLIDGPGGERILGVGAITEDEDITMMGLRVTTNRVARSREKIPCYRKLGIQYQPGQPPNQLGDFRPMQDQDDDYRLPSFERTLGQISGLYIKTSYSSATEEFATYASMMGIRKIQASTGSDGKVRGRLHISGLKFDYHDARNPPVIVGQWIAPQEYWEIAPGENIVKLSIWYFREAPCEDMLLMGSWKGKVAAVRFETSNGRIMSFSHTRSKCFTGRVHSITLDLVLNEFQANFYETLYGLSWVLNRKFDCIHGAMKPNRRAFIGTLVPIAATPRGEVHKIYFDINHLGQKDRLSRIIAHRLPDRDSIMGFSFVYDSKTQRTIGYTSDYKSRSIDIIPGSQIVEFSTRVVAFKLTLFEVRVTH
ncbi:hypothetical protein FQN54_000164 [Arachnomyces sp. PD_36]|nr:hypothetical protein FQN54_000164 [Arachnomyces sp. PD_36]